MRVKVKASQGWRVVGNTLRQDLSTNLGTICLPSPQYAALLFASDDAPEIVTREYLDTHAESYARTYNGCPLIQIGVVDYGYTGNLRVPYGNLPEKYPRPWKFSDPETQAVLVIVKVQRDLVCKYESCGIDLVDVRTATCAVKDVYNKDRDITSEAKISIANWEEDYPLGSLFMRSNAMPVASLFMSSRRDAHAKLELGFHRHPNPAKQAVRDPLELLQIVQIEEVVGSLSVKQGRCVCESQRGDRGFGSTLTG